MTCRVFEHKGQWFYSHDGQFNGAYATRDEAEEAEQGAHQAEEDRRRSRAEDREDPEAASGAPVVFGVR